MRVYHHIRQLVIQEFFPKTSDFPGKRQKVDFFSFHLVTKTHQDKIAWQNTCQCVAEWLRPQVSVPPQRLTNAARFT